MESKSFEFISKIYVNVGKANKGRMILMRICAVLFLLIALFRVLMDGISISAALFGIACPFLLAASNASNADTSGYKDSPVVVNFNMDGISVMYPNFDIQDGLGLRTEKWEVLYSDMVGIEYNNSLVCIRIIGPSKVNVEFSNGRTKPLQRDNTKSKKVDSNFLYLSPEVKDEFLNTIQQMSGKNITYLD